MVARRSPRPLLAIVVSSIVGLVVAPGLAGAHTELDYSLPIDGASIGVPVDEITVAFTSPVSLVGDGFAVLDPQNNELEPFVVTDDDTVFRLQFDAPLAGGTVAVRYEVRAEDGHVLAGNFVFDVVAPVPTTAPPATATPTTATPSTTATSSTATRPAGVIATAPPAPTQAPDETVGGKGDESAADLPGDVEDEGVRSGNGLVIALTAAVALVAGGVLIVRSRTST